MRHDEPMQPQKTKSYTERNGRLKTLSLRYAREQKSEKQTKNADEV